MIKKPIKSINKIQQMHYSITSTKLSTSPKHLLPNFNATDSHSTSIHKSDNASRTHCHPGVSWYSDTTKRKVTPPVPGRIYKYWDSFLNASQWALLEEIYLEAPRSADFTKRINSDKDMQIYIYLYFTNFILAL